MMLWIQFAICTVIIMIAGAKLSKYGDIIAEKTGLGRTWIGVLLMASVTSLPELITGLSSVAIYNLPDIAAGDVLGSCLFNLLILAMLDFLSPDKPILTRADQGHSLTAGFSILLLAVVTLSIPMHSQIPAMGWVGLYTPVILLLYVWGMRMVFRFEQKRQSEDTSEEEYRDISKTRAYVIYSINALVVIAAATWLPKLGEGISEKTGLGESFVGSLFIALSTSLPEFVVTFTALRRGATDLAVGNVLGSNLFNIAILAIDDLAYTEGPLLSNLAGNHVITASGAIFMTGIALIGLTYRATRKRLGFSGASVALAFSFLLLMVLSYLLGAPV